MQSRPGHDRGVAPASRYAWAIGLGLGALLLACGAWLVLTDAPSYHFVVRLFADRHYLKRFLREWGALAPMLFIALQALQVVISPIPGDATGFLGGYVFGEWSGVFFYSIGLSMGTIVAFVL